MTSEVSTGRIAILRATDKSRRCIKASSATGRSSTSNANHGLLIRVVFPQESGFDTFSWYLPNETAQGFMNPVLT